MARSGWPRAGITGHGSHRQNCRTKHSAFTLHVAHADCERRRSVITTPPAQFEPQFRCGAARGTGGMSGRSLPARGDLTRSFEEREKAQGPVWGEGGGIRERRFQEVQGSEGSAARWLSIQQGGVAVTFGNDDSGGFTTLSSGRGVVEASGVGRSSDYGS